MLDYYRLSADGRLLFGGGTVYGGTDPADIRAKLVPNLERVFPQLKGVRRRLRLVGELRDLVQPGAAARAARAGRAISRKATAGTGWSAAISSGESSPRRCMATASRFDVFARVPWIRFPGRTALRRALFRSRIVVVWLARPPRRVTESRKDALDELSPSSHCPREPGRRCPRWRRTSAARLQLVGLHRRGHGREVRGGDRDQGRLRRLRLERGAGGEAARRQLRLRRGGADLELPAAPGRGRRLPAARQVEAAEPRRTWTRR